MYAFANDLSDPNNDQFSSCSIEMMDNVIAERGQSVGTCKREPMSLPKAREGVPMPMLYYKPTPPVVAVTMLNLK